MSDQLKDKIIELVNKDEEFRKQLKKEINSEEQEKEKQKIEGEKDSFSRREFLKGALGSAGALGAAAMIPNAASYDITSSYPFSIYNSTDDKNFEVDTKGKLTANQIGSSSNPVDSIRSNKLNGEPEVTTESELREAIDKGQKVVRVKGNINITSTVTLPDYTTIYGYGRYWFNDDRIYGDGLTGDFNSALIDTGEHCRVYGLALQNKNINGSCILDRKAISWYYNLDLDFHGTGIRLEDTAGEGNTVETRIEHCRLTGGGDEATESVGVNNLDYTDVEFNHNVVRRCNIGFKDAAGTLFMSNNHFYNGTQNNLGQSNFESASDSPGGYHIKNNYFEGHVSTNILFRHNAFLDRIMANDFSTLEGSSADHIHWDRSSAGFGDLNQVKITDNLFRAVGSNASAAIKNSGVSNASDAEIHSNQYRNVNTENELQTSNRGQSTASGDGSSTSFTIAHNLFAEQQNVHATVTPTSSDADADFYITTDSTDITINYNSAPSSGTDNLSWNWEARTI